MPFKDPKKRKEYKKSWHIKNRVHNRKLRKLRRQEIKNWFTNYKKNLACEICGEKHPATIDFHHKSNKDNEVTQMVHWGYAFENIKKEIAKCQVLCANCHRKLHWKENNKT